MQYQLRDIENSFQGFNRLAEMATATSDLWFDELELDCTGTAWIDANMCAPLGAILYRLGDMINEIHITNLRPGVMQILRKNGFMSTYGEEKVPDTYGTTIGYTRFEPKDDRFFANYVEKSFAGKAMPRMSAGLEKRFRESIFEMFNNAAYHSETSLGIFACGQFFPNKNRLDFSIADLGNGMRRVVNDYLGSDLSAEEAINWATNDQNTTKTGNIPGGLGLKLLKEFIALNHGRIQIVSDSGYWEYVNGSIETKSLAAAYRGTVVNIEINTADDKSYKLTSEANADNIF